MTQRGLVAHSVYLRMERQIGFCCRKFQLTALIVQELAGLIIVDTLMLSAPQ